MNTSRDFLLVSSASRRSPWLFQDAVGTSDLMDKLGMRHQTTSARISRRSSIRLFVAAMTETRQPLRLITRGLGSCAYVDAD